MKTAFCANPSKSQGCRINGLRRDVTLHYDYLIFVNGGAHLMSHLFAHAHGLRYIPWIAPRVIGSFCSIYLRRYTRRKFTGKAVVSAMPFASSSSIVTPTETLAAS